LAKVEKASDVFNNFYTKFTEKYRAAGNISSTNLILFKEFKQNLDNLHDHSDLMLSKTRNPKFMLSKFNIFFISFQALFKKADIYINNLIKGMSELYEIINPDPKKLALRIIPDENSIVPFKYTIKEVIFNQNEYMMVRMNLRSFFKFILKVSNRSYEKYNSIKNKLENRIKYLKNHKAAINNQKAILNALILAESK